MIRPGQTLPLAAALCLGLCCFAPHAQEQTSANGFATIATMPAGTNVGQPSPPKTPAASESPPSLSASAKAEELLSRLEGAWRMVGDVRGKPVEYRLESTRVLQGKFVELHMVDVQTPPRYEARVFLGVDDSGKVLAHWLDSFGAAYSVPHGEGSATGNQIEFRIPYASATFRDTFRYLPDTREWTLTIEAEKLSGEWRHFAAYRLTRP